MVASSRPRRLILIVRLARSCRYPVNPYLLRDASSNDRFSTIPSVTVRLAYILSSYKRTICQCIDGCFSNTRRMWDGPIKGTILDTLKPPAILRGTAGLQGKLGEKNMSGSNAASNLPPAWIRPRSKARMHILQAHQSPRAVIIRRKPSKCFHIFSWDTATDEMEHGSWFQGRIYSERCDISWDGRWMVYLAMGSGGETWNGICQPPWLRTVADVPNMGTWAGGGFFSDRRTLRSNDNWCSNRSLSEFTKSNELPFSIERMESGGEVFPILSCRLERDGWKREGDFGDDQEITLKHSSYSTLCLNDPGWSWQPTRRHPALRMFYRGYLVHGYTFEFQLEGSSLLDPEVDWATWDAKGDLLVARQGSVERYSLEALKNGVPEFRFDMEDLKPPATNAQSNAAPNGGPAAPVDKLNVPGGPPSVS